MCSVWGAVVKQDEAHPKGVPTWQAQGMGPALRDRQVGRRLQTGEPLVNGKG